MWNNCIAIMHNPEFTESTAEALAEDALLNVMNGSEVDLIGKLSCFPPVDSPVLLFNTFYFFSFFTFVIFAIFCQSHSSFTSSTKL